MLGSGSYGDVFRHKGKALKRCKCESIEDFQAIVREIAVLSQGLTGCIPYHGFYREKESFCILMDMADGDLRRLKPPKGADKQLMQAVFELHQHGIFHRDLKPENILVKKDQIYLCDFGMSRMESEGVSGTGYVVSRWYRAPEIYYHPKKKMVYTAAMDNFSVGSILYEMKHGIPLNMSMLYDFHVEDPMIRGLVDMNPSKRLDMQACLGKPFKPRKDFSVEYSDRSKFLMRRFPHKHIYKHAERMHNMGLEYDRACLLSMLAYGSIDQLMYELKVKDVYKLNTDKIFHF